jgi:4'-phosphopantetheinyl transferase EntD
MSKAFSSFGPLVDWARRRGILVGDRLIQPGDESELLPGEARSLKSSLLEARRQSGAARRVARSLLARLGSSPCVIVKDASGAPIWPPGFIGSLAHDADVAVAAVARARDRDLSSLGIDIERNEPLSAEMAALVATPAERRRDEGHALSPLLFVVKEAVFKATFPMDGQFLDFQDVEVDLHQGVAWTRFGLGLDIFTTCDHYVSALAVLRKDT